MAGNQQRQQQEQQQQQPPVPAPIPFLKLVRGDLEVLWRMLVYAMRYPVEFYSGAMPTLNELTLGLVGPSLFNPEKEIPDLEGKVVLVTGGNAGIGKETIAQLARHRPSRLYLAARNESKARGAITSIQASLPSPADIRYLRLDLSSFKSVQAAAESFASECDRLDILILNAGTLAKPARITEDGYETQFGTNYLGHALLTRLLLPTLLKTAALPPTTISSPAPDVRVISVTSMVMPIAPPLDVMTSTSALNAESTHRQYAASKAANVLFASELARRHPEILSVSIHPGTVYSDLFRKEVVAGPIVGYGMAALAPLAFRSVRTGALNQLWAAATQRESIINGAYYTPVGAVHKNNIYVKDVGMAKKLWEWADVEFRQAGF